VTGAMKALSAGFVSRPALGFVSRPGLGVVSRPGLGVVSRPGLGVVSRPGLGVVSRPGLGVVSRPGLGVVSWPGLGVVSRPGLGVVSWPGLARPPTTLHQPNRQIVPLGIPRDDQAGLPRPGPTIQTRFTLNGGAHVAMFFSKNQAVELVPAGKRRSDTVFMCPHTPRKIACNAEVQRSVRSVGHDVNPAGGHGWYRARSWLRKGLQRPTFHQSSDGRDSKVVGGRPKTGHDTVGCPAMTDLQR
jgi:hypothetical protein